MIIISIVTHNNEKIIENTIKSILYFTKDIDFKIIVFDNFSKDKTIDVIRNIQDNRIKVIDSRSNLGFGYGHNFVINNFGADYYLIYNPDVILESNIIKKLVCYMDNNLDVGMVTPKIKYQNGDVQFLCKEDPTVFDLFMRRFIPNCLKDAFSGRKYRYEMHYTGYNKEFIVPYATGCFMLFRNKTIRDINGFDDEIFMYLEDADITRRVNQISKCIFYPYDSVIHLWEKGSHKSLYLTWVNIKSAIYYFNKWGWKFF